MTGRRTESEGGTAVAVSAPPEADPSPSLPRMSHDGGVWWSIAVFVLAIVALGLVPRLLGGGVSGDLRRRRRGGEASDSVNWRSRYFRGYRDR
jgi:hypothetical protein